MDHGEKGPAVAAGSRGAAAMRVLIADTSESCSRSLEVALLARGCSVQICRDGSSVKRLIAETPPDLVIMELRLSNGPVLKLIEWIKAGDLGIRVVVHTNHASIASAIRCAKMGVDGYYPKPAPLERLISREGHEFEFPDRESREPLPLERAIWEYLNRVVDRAGSIVRAAQLLGLDRRSLRRMLGKHAPSPTTG